MLFRRNDQQAATPAVESAAPVVVPEITDELRAAVEQVEAALAEQQRIESALAIASANVATAQREFGESNQRLSVAESAAALGGEPDKNVRKQHLACRDAVEFAAARVAGLQVRLREVQTVVIDRKRVLAVEWRRWTADQASVFLERYERALDTFLDEVAVLKDGGMVLGVGRLHGIVRALNLPDPQNPHINLTNPARLKNREVASANDLHGRLSEISRRVTPLIQDFLDKVVPEGDNDAAA